MNFLDLPVEKIIPRIKFNIHRNPTTTDTCQLVHPHSQNISAYNSLRMLNALLTLEAPYSEIAITTHIAKANGYRTNMIESIIYTNK